MKKVLVVEDDRNIARSLEVRLRQIGVKPILAYDAVMGVSAVSSHKPDVIIMDIMMPAGNGLDLAKNIQSVAGQSAPIIFITASKKYRYQEEALKLGAAGFFEKPYDTEKLIGKVSDLL